MRYIRRLLQVVAVVGTLVVGIIALALVVSQTPWFRDWLRRYIVRESKQYVNGELSIGGMGGNLLFGVRLSDVAVDMSGRRVVAIKGLEVDYSVFDIISKGVVIDGIKVVQPTLVLERDATGWNLARLIKEQRKEADREGPAAPLSLPSIELTDGTISIDDKVGSSAYRIPSRIERLHVKAGFEYAPVHYSIRLDDVSFSGTAPDLTLKQLTGGIGLRDDNLYLDKLNVSTSESTVALDGVIEDYLRTPVLKVATNGTASLPELARVAPVLEGYALTPTFDVKANGTTAALSLDLNVQTQAGNVRGQITADVQSPDLAVKGVVDLAQLNLAPLLKDPAQRSDLTGKATVDLTIASAPEAAPVLERLRGTFAFDGPRVLAAGYEAADVRVKGSLNGPRLTLDGRAAAYGGTSTTTGFIVLPAKGRSLAFDLRGRAAGVDLRRLPAAVGAPKVATKLAVSQYHVRGESGRISGEATLQSSEVEGATIGDGTVAEFATSKGNVSYAARGSVANLDLQRIGRAFKIAALDKPDYASRLNSAFDVRGAGTQLERMTLDASGTLTDSDVWGAHLPRLGYEAHLAEGGLTLRADGRFEHLNPGRVAARPSLDGSVTGTANVTARIANLSAPITADAIAADGVIALESSKVGEFQINSAAVEGRYAAQIGNLTRLTVAGPDVTLEASGQVALDKAGASNLTYHIEATDLAPLAALAGQQGVAGTAVLDGTLTGNAASLQTTGTLDGSRFAYQDNSALDLNAQYTVTVPDLDFAKAHVQATSDATFLKVAGLEINELRATTTYVEKQLAFDTSLKQPTRELEAAGDVVLHTDHQEIHLPRLAVRTQGVEWRTVAGSAATIKYGSDRIELDGVRLESGVQRMSLDGALALKGTTPAGAITIEARDVDIAQLERLALQNRGLLGRVNATAKIEGTAAAPIVSGRVVVSEGGFQSYKYDALTADVTYQGTRIGVDATLQQSPTEAITVTGGLPTTVFSAPAATGHVAPAEGEEVDLHITTTALGLGIIQGFTTVLTNVTGLLRADLRVSGSGADPHVEGILDISGGGFGVPDLGVSYSGLNTSVAFSPDRITIPNLRIVDEEGEALTITGTLATHARQLGAVDVTIASRNFELVDNELGDVGVETNLKITGELRSPRIVGNVRLQAARLEVDKILSLFYDPYSVVAIPEVISAERTAESTASAEDATQQSLSQAQSGAATPAQQQAAAEAPPAPVGAFAPVALQVKLTIPDNLVLRGKSLRPGGPTGAALGDLNITVGGDIDINKEPGGQVTLLGEVNTVRGTYQFQGRRFDLARGGTVRFIGEPQINPLLDITATRTIPNTGVEAQVHVTGTVKVPELRLTSTPSLDESDILALIVFNRPVNELGSGERASLAATAGGIATGFLAAPLGDSIGRALDLDLFEISTTTDEGELGAGLTIGQQIGDRTFFRLRQQFGERTTSEFMIEYQLADFLRMQASAAPETTGSANRIGQRRIERAGIDLIFFFSY